MADLKDSIHATTEKLTSDLKKMTMYKTFYEDLQKLVSKSAVKNTNFKNTLLEAMKMNGMENELRNTIFQWVRSHKNPAATREPLIYLRKSQATWQKRIHKSLNSMASEIKIHLAQSRVLSDKEEMNDKWNELSIYDVDLSQYRPVYAPKDFLEVLLAIRSPNYKCPNVMKLQWDFIQLPLMVKTFKELRNFYSEISRGDLLLGNNPNMKSENPNYPTLLAERTALGEKVLETNHAPVTQEYLKKGCPRSLRATMWVQVLGVEVKENEKLYFQYLKNVVLQHDLMVDKLIIKDVQLTASNDHQYFVFEDVLYQVMLCFSRDAEVLCIFSHSSAQPVHGVLRGKPPTIENTVIYPPNGIIPFHGFTMYATPFCYLYDDPVQLYYVFRAFYTRYWFRLHEVSSHPQGILSLCILFERLLHRLDNELWCHIKTSGVQPIRLTFKWIMRAFSGHLSPEQVLYLWDLILAYDSLEILPIMAVTIVGLRKVSLIRVKDLAGFEAVLADLSSITVMPLLQMVLVSKHLDSLIRLPKDTTKTGSLIEPKTKKDGKK
ncbi:unnamed protein product [Nezara viridula]|uniref:Rab-GAP TBC domain-containing protein n=1 Tax=Nezara viridula TaxID=85310 RepID=A0A9P0E4I1_NEZVI|nr:unnamed protein product [Nezara viridula]